MELTLSEPGKFAPAHQRTGERRAALFAQFAAAARVQQPNRQRTSARGSLSPRLHRDNGR